MQKANSVANKIAFVLIISFGFLQKGESIIRPFLVLNGWAK